MPRTRQLDRRPRIGPQVNHTRRKKPCQPITSRRCAIRRRPPPAHPLLLLAGCGGDDTVTADVNVRPAFVGADHQDHLRRHTDDLLTAGLGKTGLGAPRRRRRQPAAPTAAELRRLAIYNNYRALLDISPTAATACCTARTSTSTATDTLGEGKIAGTEYLAYADDGTGKQNVTMMVQVPTTFNQQPACIVTARLVRLARRLRRDRHRRRMGPEARLRGRLHRQGHGQRHPRPRDQHRQPAERHARRRGGRRQGLELHGAS